MWHCALTVDVAIVVSVLKTRLLRLENGAWRISAGRREIPGSEQRELKEYLDEIRMPYIVTDDSVCIHGNVSLADVLERIEYFYDGWADVIHVDS